MEIIIALAFGAAAGWFGRIEYVKRKARKSVPPQTKAGPPPSTPR
jgi:hypothetical protein